MCGSLYLQMSASMGGGRTITVAAASASDVVTLWTFCKDSSILLGHLLPVGRKPGILFVPCKYKAYLCFVSLMLQTPDPPQQSQRLKINMTVQACSSLHFFRKKQEPKLNQIKFVILFDVDRRPPHRPVSPRSTNTAVMRRGQGFAGDGSVCRRGQPHEGAGCWLSDWVRWNSFAGFLGRGEG